MRASGSRLLPFEHSLLNLGRKDRQMFGKPVEYLAFGFVGCEIANERALSRVLAQFLYLVLIVLHGSRPDATFSQIIRHEGRRVKSASLAPGQTGDAQVILDQ